ncbi:UDP-2-acetamido-2,6-beta-L-arabino-hexul-4-ose reductase [Thiomicrorhabdus xiamenensis]|uniref:SDR family oxidoreductase n=1 Tax=Thiomicrorhabdus xiamenensis TaxID=2739063 RepID=A0A7D4NL28_9GAMM|nr:NAD-dependent epimerase/dehydratase family protein [Thiomicrorhabdus xiamenensis]QKI89769.1 SDR family oxidoreductase [Thiomicrorhabdus xiamenensis]
MKVLITGADGFIGKNLYVHLSERDNLCIETLTRNDSLSDLSAKLEGVDFIFHLAGVNRPKNTEDFKSGNTDLTSELINAVEKTRRSIPVIYSSSIQVDLDTPYGESKRLAERALLDFSDRAGTPVFIFRLPNVFGKWSKPNYNSVVATFCHNIARGLPIQINDAEANLRLVYVDDVVNRFVSILDDSDALAGFCDVTPIYEIKLGDLAEKLEAYHDSRRSLITEQVGLGLDRALHATYLSFLEPNAFSYDLVKHEDPRGVFVEMLKTRDSGQFSFFTAHPGVTRGGHYHHSKTEKFLVLKGEALFKFRHVVTNEYYEITTAGDKPQVVETVPGWTHDITNIGDDEMIVMLWANEIFDRENPDTYAKPL